MRSLGIKYFLLYFFVFLFFHGMLQAQRFGGTPTKLKWKQIDMPSADIIFPKGMDTAAFAISKWITKIDKEKTGKLGGRSSKIPIVIQNLPVISNAYVGLGPWRSEFYTFPPQNALELGSTNWVENLVVHEYRHAHQFSNFKKGLSKFAYIVAGQQGQALANSASVPDWFFEGDAVYEETKYLSQGRGRLPYFFDPFHSIWLGKKKYSYQKLRSGSLKDLVPNHYQLGYMLVAYGYTKYGDDFWGKVTADAAAYKGLFYPFQKAIKKYSGQTYKQFTAEAIGSFRLKLPTSTTIGKEQAVTLPNEKRLINYHFPVWLDGDSLLVLKKPANEVPYWVIINKQKEKRLGIKEIGIEDYYTYKRGFIVYTANGFDPRWSWREYSDISLYNIYDGSRTRLTRGGRYLSPDLSNDGEKVVAVQYTIEGKSSLDFIDFGLKQLEHRYEHPEGMYMSYPVFSADDQQVYFIARRDNGESAVQAFDRSKNETSTLIPFVNTPISLLRAKGEWLLFTVSQESKNELWRYNVKTKVMNLVVSSSTGAYAGDLNATGEDIVYSKPTAEGEQVFKLANADTSPRVALTDAALVYPVRYSFPESEPLANDTSFSVEKFKKGNKLFNIHSWRPFYEQPDWSFTLYGENVLNTFQSSYDYTYNENEGSHKVGANLAYGGWYPWVTGATSYTINRTFNDQTRTYQWNEWNGNIGLRLPFNFTYGKLYKRLDLSATLNGQMVDYQAKSIPQPQDRFLGFVQQQMTWSMQSQQAVQQIFPRFAFVTRIQNKMTIGNTKANQLFVTGQLYLPGAMKTHALVLGASYQRRDTLRQYIFNNGFALSRGYSAFDFPRMWKWNVNYHFPIVYPDFGLANIVYFQRVRANVFYDDTYLKSLRTGRITNLRSAGTEIYFDTKWWNQQPVSFGVRYSRLLDSRLVNPNLNPNVWEFILPLNLLPN
jgi:hypothetical protein